MAEQVGHDVNAGPGVGQVARPAYL